MKSTYKFFKTNKFKVQKNINLKKLIKFFESIYIDPPLTKKLYETLDYIFKPPILYVHLCQLIDEFENDLLINAKKK
jgi:16S rRNA G966 N2-methylase RsmD